MGCCSSSQALPDLSIAGGSSVLLPGRAKTQLVPAKTGWKLHIGVKRTSHGEAFIWMAMQIGVMVLRILEIALLRCIWELQGIFHLSHGKVSNIQREASPLVTEKQLFVAVYVTDLYRGTWEKGGWEGFPPDQNKIVNHQCHTVVKMCKTILRSMARLLLWLGK